MTISKTFKKIILLISILPQLNLNALIWKQNKFEKMTDKVKECIIENQKENIPENIEMQNFLKANPGLIKNFKNPPFVLSDCNDSNTSWDLSYYIINKKNEYFHLKKPLELALKILEGIDTPDYLDGPHLIFHNGKRFGQLCFHSNLSGKESCEINMFVDFEEARVTDIEIGNFGSPLLLESTKGYMAKSNQQEDIEKNKLVIQKIFSKTEKEIIIPIGGYFVDKGEFISDNKIKVELKKLNDRKKYTRIVSFDPSLLED